MRTWSALAIALMLAACGAKTPPGTLPSGTYHYVSHEGKVTADSTVTVSRDANAVVLHEEVRFGDLTGPTIESRLDPKTYSVLAYSEPRDPEGTDPTIAISPDAATFTLSGDVTKVAKARFPGAPAWIFGDWASNFAALPALERSTHAKTMNGYMPDLLHGKPYVMAFYVVEANTPSSAGAPSGDATLALAWRPASKPVVTLWYDPASLVVDAIDFGGATAFVLQR